MVEQRWSTAWWDFSGISAAKELVRPYYLKWLYFRLRRENCPRSFWSCWRYPHAPLNGAPLQLEPAERGKQDFVFFPMGDWHSVRQRTQHLASTLANLGHRCFFINPHLGREFPQTYYCSPRQVVSEIEPRVRELHVHLQREPVFHQRCLRRDETLIVAKAVEKMLLEANSVRPVLVLSFPLWGDVAAELSARHGFRIVYDCHDLLAGFGNISADLVEAEERLMGRSDLVIFSAASLMEQTVAKVPHVLPKSVLVRNGVEVRDFEAAIHTGEQISSVPTVGYVGSLNFWFDVEMVRHAAEAHPEWRFVMVGHVASSQFDPLRKLSNVHFTGELPYEALSG